MIGRLAGAVAEVGEEEALIDVLGVGYVVRCGARTLSRLPPVGEDAIIHVETQWSEAQGPRLYGFLSRDERRAFVLLQAIQGVGPKAALAVLDVLPPAELAQAVAREDKAQVARAQGVGPKLAQRIVVELKDKPIGGGELVMVAGGGLEPPSSAQPPSIAGEAVAALMGLGVAEPAARRAVEQVVLREPDLDLNAAIKASLQELGR
ncbi:MAG: Holliday junction branch migration protein RuvA [Caulobacteraceae bacterium]|nr:Holliday junction branch migration protein RuvA [Caulobacteraceae bacterium]